MNSAFSCQNVWAMDGSEMMVNDMGNRVAWLENIERGQTVLSIHVRTIRVYEVASFGMIGESLEVVFHDNEFVQVHEGDIDYIEPDDPIKRRLTDESSTTKSKKKFKPFKQDVEFEFVLLEALVLANRPPLLPHPTGRPPVGNVGNHLLGEGPAGLHGSLLKPKLDAPKTDGSDPLRWLYKVQEYFSFYDTPPTERLHCVTLMLEGAAAG
ncbi:unnamed protein product [Cuscuta campestris]|uniref:Uncharacterized protein n=1 Tax=Cuscuta campestris TaxID=132261 RepID=A0A484L8W2_9ASTE|nr:unnamed protein product [Cuscuta campestris]